MNRIAKTGFAAVVAAALLAPAAYGQQMPSAQSWTAYDTG